TPSTVLLRHGGRMLAWLLEGSRPASPHGVLAAPHGTVDIAALVSVSDDGGPTWGSPRARPPLVQPTDLSLFPPLDHRGPLLLLDSRHLWVSEDGGATWTVRLVQIPAGLRPAWLASAVHGGLYSAAYQTGPIDAVTPSTPLTLIRSTDGGAHWSPVTLPRPS